MLLCLAVDGLVSCLSGKGPAMLGASLSRGKLITGAAAALIALGASAQSQPTAPSAELRTKAEQIVAKYTPEKTVWVRAFASGLHVTGVTASKPGSAPGADSTAGPQITVALPDWCPADRLLAVLPEKEDILLRLLWKVEPRLTPLPDVQEFVVRLANHQGYGQQTQQGERSMVRPAGLAYGTNFWTDHRIPSLLAFPPGLYDVTVASTASPQEVIPIGQALYVGEATNTPEIAQRLLALLPGGAPVLAGNAVLARWARLRVPVHSLSFAPHSLAIVSSADWLEDTGNLTPVATITVTVKGGPTQSFPILLGRDTASTWYNLHARGNVRHEQAPIAWSWNERQDTVDFEACVYIAKYALRSEAPIESIDITYALDKGVLRIRGIELMP